MGKRKEAEDIRHDLMEAYISLDTEEKMDHNDLAICDMLLGVLRNKLDIVRKGKRREEWTPKMKRAERLLKKYSDKETGKMVNGFDSTGFLENLDFIQGIGGDRV